MCIRKSREGHKMKYSQEVLMLESRENLLLPWKSVVFAECYNIPENCDHLSLSHSPFDFHSLSPCCVPQNNFIFYPQKSSQLWTLPSQIFVQWMWLSEAVRTNFSSSSLCLVFFFCLCSLSLSLCLYPLLLLLMHCTPPSTRLYWLHLKHADLIIRHHIDGPMVSHTHPRLLPVQKVKVSPLVFAAGASSLHLVCVCVFWSLCNLFRVAKRNL